MMRTVISVVLGLLAFAEIALAQVPQPDPNKSANRPWQVDQRCAVMSAHMYNQGSLTAACLPVASGRPYINQTPGYQPAQSQVQHSVLPQRQRSTPPTDSRE